ncbi:MAG: hypothetical protein AB8H03_03295 [Saprospiraceae bacterium]
MFHLKLLTYETHADLSAIKAIVTANPKRKFTTQLAGYSFDDSNIKELIQKECGICINKEDNISNDKMLEYINRGKENIVLCPKDIPETDLENYLQKGASIIVGRQDDFDVFQIKKLVVKGKEKVFVRGGQLLENHIKDYLVSGGSILLKHKDLNARAISKLLPYGEGRIYIQSGGFSNFRIDKYLEGKAIVIFGKGNLLTTNRIKEKVEEFKSQIRIESAHPTFDLPWVKEMENLGAIII